MTRPCTCETEGCRLCWLFHNDTRYTRMWSDQPKVTAQSSTGNVYLINLDRRPDRLEQATQEFKKAGVEFIRFAAVDGNAVQYEHGFKAGGGALGCKLSHVGVLRDAVARGLDEVWVFEDDVVFVDGYQEKLHEFMKEVNEVDPDWQGVFLGGQHMKSPERVADGVCLCVDTHRTHAYVVRGPYIAKLLDLFEKSDNHIDHIWGRHQVADKPKIYAPFPDWLAGQGAGKSDINGRNLSERYWRPNSVKAAKTIKTSVVKRQEVFKPRPMCHLCNLRPKRCCGKPCMVCEVQNKGVRPSRPAVQVQKVDFDLVKANAAKFGFTS